MKKLLKKVDWRVVLAAVATMVFFAICTYIAIKNNSIAGLFIIFWVMEIYNLYLHKTVSDLMVQQNEINRTVNDALNYYSHLFNIVFRKLDRNEESR